MPYAEGFQEIIVNVQWGGSAWVSITTANSVAGDDSAKMASHIILSSKGATIASTYERLTHTTTGLTRFYVWCPAVGGSAPPNNYPHNGGPLFIGNGFGPEGFNPNDPFTFTDAGGAAACAAYFNDHFSTLVFTYGLAVAGSFTGTAKSSAYDATYVLKFPSFPSKPAFSLILSGAKGWGASLGAYTIKTHKILSPNVPLFPQGTPPSGPLDPVDSGVWQMFFSTPVKAGTYPFMLKRAQSKAKKATITELWPTTTKYTASYSVKDAALSDFQIGVGNNLSGPPPPL